MKILNFILIFLLVSCGIQEDELTYAEKYPWDGIYTVETALGIKINLGENLHPDFIDVPSPQILAELIDILWFDIQECTNIFKSIDRQVVIDYQTYVESGANGFIYWIDAYTYARIVYWDFNNNNKTTRHELLHYLLFLNGLSLENNSNHNSSYFEICA